MDTLIKDSRLALAYFLLIALLGVVLRLFQLIDIPANYKYIVHTHSHVALLGWVYTALTTLIYKLYLSKALIERKYRVLFWSTQITIVGMLLTFPFTGYALLSIIFSTLFLIASYIFTGLFIRYTSIEQKRTNSYKCIRIALWYMVVSSIGPWALGIIMNTAVNDSNLYRNAIYFYLHFQYNGWFIMALFGIFFYILEEQKIKLSNKTFQQFFWAINLGVVATFGISLLWIKPHSIIYLVSFLGALLQAFAVGLLVKGLLPFTKEIASKSSKLFFHIFKIVTLLFLVKLLLQVMVSISYFTNSIASNTDFIIGYVHWVFLGAVSLALLWYLNYFKFIELSKRAVLIYLIGFIITEGLIFYKGLVVWWQLSLLENYFWYLVIGSSILMIAIVNIFQIQFRGRNY